VADDGWVRRVNISHEREILIVPLLTVENVMRMLVCSRSSAYEHMNCALGRTERTGKLLRVPLDVFESYVVHTLGLAAPSARQPASTMRPSGPAASVASERPSGAPAIRVAKAPRSRR
jgi:hypothetical protein